MNVERKGEAKIIDALIFNNDIYILGDMIEVEVYDSKSDSVITHIGRITRIDSSRLYMMLDVSTFCHAREIRISPINILNCKRVN